MILAKTANESTYFSVFKHRSKFLDFKHKRPLQKTFAPHGSPLNNVCLLVPYLPLKFVPILMGHTVYSFLSLLTSFMIFLRWCMNTCVYVCTYIMCIYACVCMCMGMNMIASKWCIGLTLKLACKLQVNIGRALLILVSVLCLDFLQIF